MDVEFGPLRWAGAGMLALGVVLPHLPGNPGLPCPLRTVTGVPCPFCGLTTSVKAVLHGNGRAAWGANPFGLLVVALAVALVVRPGWRRASVPTVLVLAGVALSWLFELHRYHFL
jgi:ABC-type Fe3+-siderophore transport system permease subunit